MKDLFFYLVENTKSQYSVLPEFLNGFERACLRKGIRTKRMRIDTGSIADIEKMLQDDKPTATIGFNIVLDGGQFHVPHIAWIVDSAPYFWELHDFKKTYTCFIDDDSRKLFEQCGRPDTLFLPHAIDTEFLERPLNKKREFEVVLAGSYLDADRMLQVWTEYFPQEIVVALLEAAKRALNVPDMPIFLALHHVLEENPSVKQLADEMFGFLRLSKMLDVYVRGLDRVGLVESLIADFDVHIFSSDDDRPKWKERFPSRVTFHEECPGNQLFDLFASSKFVLNSVPQIKHGLHERLLLGLAAGANVVSFETSYLKEVFPESSSLLLYRHNQAGLLKDKMMRATFGRDQKLCSIIQREHSWDARLDTIVQTLFFI